jgi:hypothetical protein
VKLETVWGFFRVGGWNGAGGGGLGEGVVGGGLAPAGTAVTVTVKLFGAAALFLASFALHVTVVIPTANNEPEAGRHVTETRPSTRSSAVTPYATTAPLEPAAAVTIGAGTAMAGGVLSVTVTANVPTRELWLASVAVHVTVVTPTEKVSFE